MLFVGIPKQKMANGWKISFNQTLARFGDFVNLLESNYLDTETEVCFSLLDGLPH